MLSILIPIYRYDLRPLVKQLVKQAASLNLAWEIRLTDDASGTEWQNINSELSNIKGVYYDVLTSNIGRSAIRNRLAQAAQYDYLLFMDGDSGIENEYFLSNYIQHSQQDTIICGGRSYTSTPPNKDTYLHWYYGSKREVRSANHRSEKPHAGFMTNNFIVPKAIALTIPFDESIQGYGHEDTLFGYQLQKAGINIRHIDNPLIHVGLDTSEQWLKKQEQAIKNLYTLHLQYPELKTKALQAWLKLHRFGALRASYSFFTKQAPTWLHQLQHQQSPNLRLLDLLKLYWLEQTHREHFSSPIQMNH